MPRSITLLHFIFFATLSPFMSSAQEKLSLSDAIEIASKNSLASFKSKNLYLSGYWEFRAYNAQLRPSMRLTATPFDYNRSFVKVYNSVENINEYVEQKYVYSTINPSITQNLPFSGGSLIVDTQLSRLQSYGDNQLNQFSTVPYRINLIQPLGGFNSFKWQRKIAPIKYEKAKRNYIQSREDISLEMVNSFFDLLEAQTKISIAQNNLSNADTLHKIGLERFAIASISQADVLTLKINVANAKNILYEARKKHHASLSSFNSYLRLKENTLITLLVPEVLPTFQVDFDEAFEIAKVNNSALFDYQQQLLEAQSLLDQTKREAFTNSTINASVGLNQQNARLLDSYLNAQNQQKFTINLSVPIIDWGQRRGKINMAKTNYEIIKLAVEQAQIDFRQKIQLAVNNFNLQREIVLNLVETMNLAKQAYIATNQRFLSGKLDANFLDLAVSRKDQATLNYFESLRAYWNYYYTIRQLTLYDFENNISLIQNFDEISRPH